MTSETPAATDSADVPAGADRATAARERVVTDVAAALGVPPAELTDDTDLMDAGLDSVRIMSLVEKWRAAGFEEVDFPTLASDTVLASWIDALSA